MLKIACLHKVLHTWLCCCCWSCITARAAASTRVLEYYSSSKLLEQFFTTRVLVNFYFRLQIFISGCSFLQPIDNFIPIGATYRPCRAKNLKIGLWVT